MKGSRWAMALLVEREVLVVRHVPVASPGLSSDRCGTPSESIAPGITLQEFISSFRMWDADDDGQSSEVGFRESQLAAVDLDKVGNDRQSNPPARAFLVEAFAAACRLSG